MTALAVLALAACGESSKNQAAAPAPASDLPPGCTVAEIDHIIREFLVRPSLAPAGSFEVYATYESDGRKFVARKPARALAQIKQRLRLGEKNRVIELRVGKQDFNRARITVQLTRYAPDFLERGIHTRLAKGGGTIDCAHQTVAAWVTKGP
jgi:hypothetical protein